jgi:hypothetical protein
MKFETGRYLCEVTGNTLTKSKSGTTQVAIGFSPVHRELPDGRTEEFESVITLRTWLPVTHKAASWTADQLKQLGFEGELSQLDEASPSFVDLSGKKAIFTCRNREGSDYQDWKIFTPKETTKTVKIDSVELAQIDAEFGEYFGTATAAASAAPVAETSADQPF